MDKVRPLVSVISGYYNRENFVDESIKSLINQTYSNIEVIIFDDYSTDNTYSNLLKFASDKRVRIIRHEVNKGFVKGLIDAISESKGEYIAIHGSGDISHPNRIEKQVTILDKFKDVGVVGCTVTNIRYNKNYRELYRSKINTTKFHGSAKEIILQKNLFTHGEVMFRRTMYEEVGGYRPLFTYAQDRDLWCRMSKVCNFYIVPEPLYSRKLLPDGVGSKLKKLIIQKMLSEFARQCHERVLKGGKDYIDEFGNQALFFFKYNKRISKEFFFVCYRKYLASDFSEGKWLARFVPSKTINFYSLKSYFYFYLLAGLTKRYFELKGRRRSVEVEN